MNIILKERAIWATKNKELVALRDRQSKNKSMACIIGAIGVRRDHYKVTYNIQFSKPILILLNIIL